MRIETVAANHGVDVHWRPFLLGPIFQSFGWETSPFLLQKHKGNYVWSDMQRQCIKYNLDWQKPSDFPRAAVLATRVALTYRDAPWIGHYCRSIMRRNFVLDQDIGDTAIVKQVLTQLNLDPPQIEATALSDEHKPALRAQTQLAAELGIFGAPTFFVGEEMFWGNDRLDDAIQYAARSSK